MCGFESLVPKVLLDSLAAFCVVANPVNSTEIWWSGWGGALKHMNLDQYEQKAVISVVDSSCKTGRITNVAFHPIDPDTMFACGLMMQGIYRSTDGGASWSVVLRKKYKHTWYSGESLIVQMCNERVIVICANFSTGTIDWSYDLGATWETHKTTSVNSICSIAIVDDSNMTVVAGTRTGTLLKVNLISGHEEIIWRSRHLQYLEIPRIRRIPQHGSAFALITAGFDSTKNEHGFIVMDAGWTDKRDAIRVIESYMPNTSIWGLEFCPEGRHVILGGFSEFSRVKGAGNVVAIDLTTQKVERVVPGFDWDLKLPSVWDIESCVVKGDVRYLALASESGLFILESIGSH